MSAPNPAALNRAQFDAWLADLAARRQEAGCPRSAGDCPLARYLMTRPGATAIVGKETATVTIGTHEWREVLPAWARAFVRAADARVNSFAISAEAARAMLADIP